MPNRPVMNHTYGGRGYVLDGATLQALLNALVTRITGGVGIQVQWFGSQLVISATGMATPAPAAAGFTIDTVDVLPAIPEVGFRIVFLRPTEEHPESGVEPSQLWFAAAGYTNWTPMVNLSGLSGAPPAEV